MDGPATARPPLPDDRGAAATRARTAGVAGGGVVDLLLVLGVALVVAVVAVVAFGPQLAAILDYIGAQAQQPA